MNPSDYVSTGMTSPMDGHVTYEDVWSLTWLWTTNKVLLKADSLHRAFHYGHWTFLMTQTVKRLPAMRETRVWSLGREDLLEKEMATHSSTLAWKIHGQRSLVGYSPWGCKESDMTERLHFTSQGGTPWWLSGKESTGNVGDVGLVPGLERSLGENGKGKPV